MREIATDLRVARAQRAPRVASTRSRQLLDRIRRDYDELQRVSYHDPRIARMAEAALLTQATMMPTRLPYASALSEPVLAANTINTFTGPQDVLRATTNGAFQSAPTLLALGYLKAGTVIRTEAWGSFSTTVTPTLVFGVYTGVATTYTPLAVNVVITTASGAVTLPWHLRCVTHIRSASTPTACVSITQGELWYGTTLTATTQVPIPGIALATTNIDNSVQIEWTVCATWSASSVSNVIVLHAMSVEELTQF